MIRLLEPWRTRLLWLSLGVNLFAAGLLAAPLLWPHRPPPGQPGFDRLVERMARSLPPGDADTFRTVMEQERPWYESSRRRLDEARQELGRQVGRQPFDPASIRDAMGALQDRLRESGTRFDDSLVAALGAVSPDGRSRLSQDLVRRRP